MAAAGHVYDLLSPADLDLIHDGAFEILERMGMEIQDHQLLEVLAEHGAQVGYDAERVTFSAGFVERFIAEALKHDWDGAMPRVHGSARVYESLYHDPESGELMPWTEERLAHCFALARRMPRVSGASMLGSRIAVPELLERLYERFYCWKYGCPG